MKKRTGYFLIAIIAVLVLVIVAATVMFMPRLNKIMDLKRGTVNTYAIQNVKTGMDIRPFNAEIADETDVIQYTHNNWECMTWQFIKIESNTYLLKNLFTHKTFQPLSAPDQGVALWQQPLEANDLQYWEFIEQENEKYLIRLKGTELYLSVSTEEKNSPIILMPLQDTESQLWVLIEQHPLA